MVMHLCVQLAGMTFALVVAERSLSAVVCRMDKTEMNPDSVEICKLVEVVRDSPFLQSIL